MSGEPIRDELLMERVCEKECDKEHGGKRKTGGKRETGEPEAE